MAQAQGGQGSNGQESAKAAVPRDARWWTGLSGDAKNTFLEGYAASMSYSDPQDFKRSDQCCPRHVRDLLESKSSKGRGISGIGGPKGETHQ